MRSSKRERQRAARLERKRRRRCSRAGVLLADELGAGALITPRDAGLQAFELDSVARPRKLHLPLAGELLRHAGGVQVPVYRP